MSASKNRPWPVLDPDADYVPFDEHEEFVLSPRALPSAAKTAPADQDSTSDDLDEIFADLVLSDSDDESCTSGSSEVLPPHACAYCGIHSVASVARCVTCGRWFCNSSHGATSGSHLVQHLVRARHREISLHPDAPVGDAILECYNCGCRNIFLLGFIPARGEAVVVLLCRQPCASGGGRDSTWDLEAWQPLIAERALVSWLVRKPTEAELLRARHVTAAAVQRLEEVWKSNPAARLVDLQKAGPEAEPQPVKLRYEDAFQYQNTFLPLIHLEAELDRRLKEAQTQESISIRWDIGLNQRRIAWFTLSNVTADVRVVAGDEIHISHGKWSAVGYIIRVPPILSDEIAVEMKPSSSRPPVNISTGFRVEFIWNSATFSRMEKAMRTFAINEKCVSSYLFHRILGHDMEAPLMPIGSEISFGKLVTPGIPELNHSQLHAVKSILSRSLSLIQGPPGTGKTVVSTSIVYHLAKRNNGPVLVCAPSNVAVDQLTERIHATGLRVLRLAARSREDIGSSVSFLALHEQVLHSSKELEKLALLKTERGELSTADEERFKKLQRAAEAKLLGAAEVICTTCAGAGDPRLGKRDFKAVLLDEATQATEPESLIAFIRGAEQVVLVGDHRQLGPVIVNKQAAKAGLGQSLFERLINLGHRPLRLQVQYRMHPCLSEFPSNMFYDGSLQNGVTMGERTRILGDFPWPSSEQPMMFWHCSGVEELGPSGTSYLNRTEAGHVEKIVTKLLKAAVLPSQIGVITPYDSQRAHVVAHMNTAGSLRSELYAQVEIASVDAFQGREKDYVIVSCVRSNVHQGIGFLSDARRLNVALTRARYGLIILGNARVLARNPLWHHLIDHFRTHECLVEGSLAAGLRQSLIQFGKPPRPLTQAERLKLTSLTDARPAQSTDLESRYSPSKTALPMSSTMHTISYETLSQTNDAPLGLPLFNLSLSQLTQKDSFDDDFYS